MLVSKTIDVDVEIDDAEVCDRAEELGMIDPENFDPPPLIEQFRAMDGLSKDQFLAELREECRMTKYPWPA